MSVVGIIGAGMAGIACADRLVEAGRTVTILEKSRGTGGRLATRRRDGGLTWDHGAQYASVRGDPFRRFLERMAAENGAATWAAPGEDRWVGLPGMSGLVKPAARRLDIRTGVRAGSLGRSTDGWSVTAEDGTEHGPFAHVVVTAPPPQTAALLAPEPAMAARVAAVTVDPCWALMLALSEAPDLPALTRHDDGPIALVAREDLKPGRAETPPRLTVHASPGWSETHLEETPEAARDALLALLPDLTGPLPRIVDAEAHRWRYAMTRDPLGEPYLASPSATLWAAGDWTTGARIEAAFESGRQVAEAILAA